MGFKMKDDLYERGKAPVRAIKKPESLRREVYERIKTAIVTKKFSPGQRLEEKYLSDSLEVSRTPIREALTRLEHEGLVGSITNRGSFVKRFTVEDILEIMELREVTEGLAARLFAQRAGEKEVKRLRETMEPFTIENVDDDIDEYNQANVEFHNTLMRGARNSRLVSALENLYDHYAVATTLRIIPLTRRGRRSLQEHLRIIEAIQDGEAGKAEDEMRQHIRSIAEDFARSSAEISDLM
jgi:DNA-binding GntR family transcriptional regulator